MELVHPGPHLTRDDIVPFVTKQRKDTLYSMVPGFIGPIRLVPKSKARDTQDKNKALAVYIRNSRMIRIDFTRGIDVVIVRYEGRYFILPKTNYEKKVFPENVPLTGS